MQMRLQNDPAYYSLLKDVRDGTLTQADVNLLSTRVVINLGWRPDRLTHAIQQIVPSYQLTAVDRHICVKPIAACHARPKKAKGGRDLPINKSLEIPVDSKVKAPGLLHYTIAKDMPTTVLSNISTPPGIINKAHGCRNSAQSQ